MVDVLTGAGAVLLSLAVCLAVLRLLQDRPADSRGIAGLGVTVVHLLLSLALPAVVWILRKPANPLGFMAGVLVFYWLSLIILVLSIIRWVRAAQVHLSTNQSDSRPNDNI